MDMCNSDIADLLLKYHSGHISREEFIRLKTLMEQSRDEEIKPVLQQHWELYSDEYLLSSTKKDELFHRLERKIHLPKRFSLLRYWIQIAASIILAVGIGMSVMVYLQYRELQLLGEHNVTIRSNDSPSTVILPDGTKVRLNMNSVLTYKQDFGHKDRTVKLLGEGYFDVTHCEEKRFVVETDYINITVLGTSFNVYAYENKDFLEMSLVRGRVCVNTNQPPYNCLYARPNEKITYDKSTGKLRLEHTLNHVETSWVQPMLTFSHTPLHEVFDCLERKFNVTICSVNTALADDSYTGTFKDESLEDILDILKLHYDFDYTRMHDTIRIEMGK